MEKINKYYNLILQEYGLLDRVIYKFKNQHGRLNYFRSIFRIIKELKLFIAAYNETFFNINSTEDSSVYLKNVIDIRKITRRIKWDLKNAGLHISRLLAHGFHLPLVFLLLSILSRIYSVIINFKITTEHIISLNKLNHNSSRSSNYNSELFDQEIDFGEPVDNNNKVQSDNGKNNCEIKNKHISDDMNINDYNHNNNNHSNHSIITNTNENCNFDYKKNQAWCNHMILRSKRRKLTLR